MVSFATLILFLVTGIYPVEVMVDQSVAVVEIQLDGEVVGRLTDDPWRLEVDFGQPLQPHELVAVAKDAQGRELSRARQMVNLPRPPAEVALSLEKGSDGRYRSARAAWEVVGDREVDGVQALFDGSPLSVTGAGRIELPSYDPDVLHYLVVQVRFEGDVQAEAAVAVGGHFGESHTTEITSVAVELRNGHEELPAGSLDGWFRKNGRPLNVVAAENSPAGILLVLDRSSEAWRRVLGVKLGTRRAFVGPAKTRDGVRPDDAVHLMDTVPRLDDRHPDRGAWLFPVSQDLARYRRGRGITWTLTDPGFGDRNPGRPRPAQAVATAALHAAGLGRSRTVVLVVGSTVADYSLYDPDNVLRYLETLQVPFLLWTLGDEVDPSFASFAGKWDGATDISDPDGLFAAVDELRTLLDRQRIVWVEGRHLPQRIELSDDARQIIEFAGR